MGYACPVCETPQSDAGHLANHLAITAIARGGDHEAWLDEHVPGWGDLDESALAERVVDHADDADYPQVFEDTTGRESHGHGHDHESHGHDHDHGAEGHGGRGASPEGLPVDVDEGLFDDGDLDDDAEEIVARARDLTRRRRSDGATGGADDAGREDAAPEDAAADSTDDSETE